MLRLIYFFLFCSTSSPIKKKSFYDLSIEDKDKYLGVFSETHLKKRREDANFYNLSIEEQDKYLGVDEHFNLNLSLENILVSDGNSVCLKPSKVDLRNYKGNNTVTHVKDQGQCGSCVAFAALSLLENIYLQKNVYKDFSENDLFFCKGKRSCNYGWFLSEASKVLKNEGVNDEHCCLYSHHFGRCCNHCEKSTKIDNYFYLYDDEIIKKWISDSHHIMTYFYVYSDFYNYRGGIYYQKSNDKRGAHAVAVIGFNDIHGYWIAKNSWGNDWGEGGFFRIKYNEVSFLNYGIVYVKKELDDYDDHPVITGCNNLFLDFFMLSFLSIIAISNLL